MHKHTSHARAFTFRNFNYFNKEVEVFSFNNIGYVRFLSTCSFCKPKINVLVGAKQNKIQQDRDIQPTCLSYRLHLTDIYMSK